MSLSFYSTYVFIYNSFFSFYCLSMFSKIDVIHKLKSEDTVCKNSDVFLVLFSLFSKLSLLCL